MSFYFREKPRFGDKLRGKPRDELLQELKQQFDDSSKSFFEPATTRPTRDPFERHTGFSRGFPFDDVEGFGRRDNDIRSHLDDLASRHPEFADHLLGSAWGDVPAFYNPGSLRNRRRRGSGSSSSYQGHPDEDTRSQTSGSSGNSAASGASGVSSHGEPATSSKVIYNEKQQEPPSKQQTRRNPIPQYGLRNTVDIGQHRHDMENPDKSSENRGQRSMSAPPENRQQNDVQQDAQQQQQNPQNPRFVSRVDITPQFVQPPGSEKAGAKPQPQSQQQKPQQQQSNVRHIPIFVEGRDEPVIPKNVEADSTDGSSWTYAKPQNTTLPGQFQQSPQFPPPPQFHRPSHFNQHYPGGRAKDWLPSFDEEFYSPQGSFAQPGFRRTRQQQPPFASQSPPRQGPQFRQTECNSGPSSQRQQHESPYFAQQSNPQHSTPPQHHQQQQQQPQQQEIPVQTPRKQTQPKDPLEKVAEVQKEVDSLTEQVKQWNGPSRKDKEYMYLDEMLTRELIKLDDLETEGKENVRQARKNAIKSIQDSISLLESKAPLSDQPPMEQKMEIQQETVETTNEPENTEAAPSQEEKVNESKETGTNEQPPPIPLPAAPSSPTKEPVTESSQVIDTTGQPKFDNNEQTSLASEVNATASMEVTPVAKVSSAGSMEVQSSQEVDRKEEVPASQTAGETSMEVENHPKGPQTPKNLRKTKKQPQQQTPISDGAIPLPAPESQPMDATK